MTDSEPIERAPEDELSPPEEFEEEAPEKPALTIVIQSWATPILALVMLIIGLAGGYFGRPLLENRQTVQSPVVSQPTSEVQPTTDPVAAATAEARGQQLLATVIGQTRHFLGDENAPVTIIEFSDFQWPYCGKFATGAGRQIIEEYVNSGKVRLGYIHFAFLGDESYRSAEASECAAEQDKFWEYHDVLFDSQSGENQGAFTDENLIKFAQQIDLDADKFTQCLTSDKYKELVQTESDFGRQIGVQSTPSFLVNTIPVVGAQPYENFAIAIESELSKIP